MDELRIALLQLLPGHTQEENLQKGLAACKKAKALGARLAELLPSAEVFDTCTNFVYIKTPAAAGIFRRLADEGIAVRCFDGALRITAGTDAENAALLEALGRLPAELK